MAEVAHISRDDTRHAYFEAAYSILATEGYGGLKLAAVCRRLSVSTGGFYHWFTSWQEFTDAMLDDWRHHRTTAVAELARSIPDPVARLESLAATTTNLNRAAEGAIRVWSRVDPKVGEVQRLVDEQRFEVVVDAMRDLVGPEAAHRFARLGYSVLVGFELLTDGGAADELAWSLDQVLQTALRHAAV